MKEAGGGADEADAPPPTPPAPTATGLADDPPHPADAGREDGREGEEAGDETRTLRDGVKRVGAPLTPPVGRCAARSTSDADCTHAAEGPPNGAAAGEGDVPRRATAAVLGRSGDGAVGEAAADASARNGEPMPLPLPIANEPAIGVPRSGLAVCGRRGRAGDCCCCWCIAAGCAPTPSPESVDESKRCARTGTGTFSIASSVRVLARLTCLPRVQWSNARLDSTRLGVRLMVGVVTSPLRNQRTHTRTNK